MSTDLPNMSASAITNTVYGLGDNTVGHVVDRPADAARVAREMYMMRQTGRLRKPDPVSDAHAAEEEESEMTKKRSDLRVVRVFLVDPDTRVPPDKRMLYCGDETVTDATDEELFHEISIKEILDRHNGYRESVIDKTIKDRTEYLEPIRIRDLSMVVATIAEF